MRAIIAIILLMALLSLAPKTETVHVVRMVGMKFIPKSLEINVGETVRWINESGTSHNVVADDGSFRSNILDHTDDSFEYNFRKEGEFRYYCQPHKMMGMKGVVIVKK